MRTVAEKASAGRVSAGTLPMPPRWCSARPVTLTILLNRCGQTCSRVSLVAVDRLRAEPGHVIEEADGTQDDLRGCVASFLSFDRNCPSWYPYLPGLSPKEHWERLDMMALEQARRDHDLKLAQLGAASRASQERIEADSLEIAKATKSFTTVWTFVAVGLAGILVAIAILTYLHIQPH